MAGFILTYSDVNIQVIKKTDADGVDSPNIFFVGDRKSWP